MDSISRNTLRRKLSNGNYEAFQIIYGLSSWGSTFDSMNQKGPYWPLLLLEELDIKGQKVSFFWDSICDSSLSKALLFLRAFQLSILSVEEVDSLIAIESNSVLDWDILLDKVKSQVPNWRTS